MLKIPNISPQYVFDFKNTKILRPELEVVRASDATYFNSSGKLVVSQPNKPRIGYDPITKKCKGLLVESSRTNIMFPSVIPTMAASTYAGRFYANGTVTATTGIPDPMGSNVGARIVGATQATNSHGTSNIRIGLTATENGNYGFSFFAKSDTGSVLTLREPNNNNKYHPNIKLTNEWVRYEFVVQAAADDRNLILFLREGQEFDIYGLQLESGNYCTSYIPATTEPATRAIETVRYIFDRPIENLTAVIDAPKGNGRYVLELVASNNGGERFIIETPSNIETTKRRFQYVAGATTLSSLGLFENSGAIAFSVKRNKAVVCDAKGLVKTVEVDDFPENVTIANIGALSNNHQRQDGFIRRIVFYNSFLEPDELQAIAKLHEQ